MKNLAFIVVGPEKTATTFLYDLIERKYSEKFLFPKFDKEIFFFDKFFSLNPRDYRKNFQEASGCVFFESSPSYFSSLAAIKNVKSFSFENNFDIKVLILYRDPKERFVSHLNHEVSNGVSTEFLWSSLHSGDLFTSKIFQSSLYEKYFEKWVDALGCENVHVINQGCLNNDLQSFSNALSTFFGFKVEVTAKDVVKRSNQRLLPRSGWVARVKRRVVYFLKSIGLAKLVALLKNNRYVYKIIYSGSEASVSFTCSDNYGDFVEKALENERLRFGRYVEKNGFE